MKEAVMRKCIVQNNGGNIHIYLLSWVLLWKTKTRKKRATTCEANGEKTPERNRFNERDLTGRFAKSKRKTKITTSLNDGLKAWEAKRKLLILRPN